MMETAMRGNKNGLPTRGLPSDGAKTLGASGKRLDLTPSEGSDLTGELCGVAFSSPGAADALRASVEEHRPNPHQTHSDATACQLPQQYWRHAPTFAKLLIPKEECHSFNSDGTRRRDSLSPRKMECRVSGVGEFAGSRTEISRGRARLSLKAQSAISIKIAPETSLGPNLDEV